MRILCIADMRPGGNGPERVQTIRELGYETLVFDSLPFRLQPPRLIRSLAHRLNFGPPLARMNAALCRFAQDQQFDALWVDKGTWLYPQTLAKLKQQAKHQLAVHFTPDFQFHDNRSRHFFSGLDQYDLLVTTKPAEVTLYRNAGARDTLLIHQGCSARFRPCAGDLARRKALTADVIFIGRHEPSYAGRLQAAAATGKDLAIWGGPWPSYAQRHAWAAKAVRGNGLWGDDYPAALGASRIALGLLTKRSPETATTRTFEIPACGGFLLAERTEEHQGLYDEGQEADFFSEDQELADKIQFYLAHSDVRDKIAAAGRRRWLASGYDTRSQYRRVFQHLALQHKIPDPA